MRIIGKDPADDKRKINKASAKQEKRTANSYKGSRNARSGAGWLRKNDVRAENFLIENKLTTGLTQITLKALDLVELRERAIIENRLPVLQFDIGGRRYVVIPEDDFLEKGLEICHGSTDIGHGQIQVDSQRVLAASCLGHQRTRQSTHNDIVLRTQNQF